ncbi:hypothetical protein SAMN05421874_13242 [Nonomuraea maritima]|uniref:Transcriptional regulator n=1 Tax=Nonomuraea maritima TaxID=683260 RepID=A0A1G9NUR1_9ACTN|nr:hypothetical protein [Nonomuraea maritima]SDL90326.1 hypothetical protein SAMN05421874_13242 [Nonomuraea maritima]
MEREPNHLLQQLIAEAGFSHKGLARCLNHLGAARGTPGLKYDHSSVLRWIGGQRPRDPVPSLLAEVFALRLGRSVTPEHLGMPAPCTPLDLGQEFTHTWQEGITTVTALWRADVERRKFLVDSTFAIGAGSVGAMRWLTSPPGPDVGGDGSRRVGHSDITAIKEVTRSFGELDNRFGSGRVRNSVVKYLDTAVSPLLKDGSYSTATGKELAAAAAELTRLAGWMAYDMEQHGLAQRYLIQALSLARGAGDHTLGGEILAGMAHQAIYMGQPAHALDLARASQLAARTAGIKTLQSSAHVLEAHAHAGLGDARACSASLNAAERAFAARKPDKEPPWLSYFDEAYLSAKFAHCFRDLGDGRRTVEQARRSLDMDGRYVRGRMFNLSLLAAGLLQCGELEEACTAVNDALALAGGLQSVRSRSYAADLRRRLHPYRNERPVRRLRELTAV